MFGQLAKKQWQKFSDSIMLRFNETKVAKEEFYGAKKKKKKNGMLMLIYSSHN